MKKATPTIGSIENRIFDLISDEADMPRETLDRQTILMEIGDSLTRVETVMALEDEFEISLPDAQVDNVRTLGELIELVSAAVRERKKPATDGDTSPSL